MLTRLRWIELVAIGVAVVVAVAAVAQAVRGQSLEPIWTVSWIPAVLAAALARPQTTGRCARRLHRPSRS
jgi:hypothetical protein